MALLAEDAMSQYSLGVLHELGEGVPQSDAQAQFLGQFR